MLNLIAANALAASRLYKRIMRHYCYMQIYEKKKANIKNRGIFKLKNVTDDDLFIEFKLDLESRNPANKDEDLFDLLR